MKGLFSLVILALVCGTQARYYGYHNNSYTSTRAEPIIAWMNFFQDTLVETGPHLSPPFVGRELAIITTSMYDTWATFDRVAAPTYPNPEIKRFGSERDIREAVETAAYTALLSTFQAFPTQTQEVNDFYLSRGFSIPVQRQAARLGQRITRNIVEIRASDGANSLGDEPNTNGAAIFSDYTLAGAQNPPQEEVTTTDCDALNNLNNWQPIRFVSDPVNNIEAVQQFLSPQAMFVTPYASDVFKMMLQFPGPPAYDSNTQDQYEAEMAEVVDFSAGLDDRNKILAEFWADGPRTTFPPGHWADIAIETCENDDLTLAQCLKLVYLQGNAAMDAGIVSWGLKRLWQSVRPITGIQCIFAGQTTPAWAGPYQGVQPIDLSTWVPYQASTFVTPPFPGYVSGHSTFSAASAEVFKRFYNGDDRYRGNSVTILEGESLFEPRIDSGFGFIDGVTNVPNQGINSQGYVPASDITLSWNTWTEAADEAGLSRIHGGIHIAADNVDGLTLGRQIGVAVFNKAAKLFNGIRTEMVETVVRPFHYGEEEGEERGEHGYYGRY